MNRNVQNTESSLLLQLPKSVLSFSDMSGNSFLLPVAVENVAESESNLRGNSSSEKQEETSNVAVTTSVCQLQQPLLMRRGSSPTPKMAVPYSESSVPPTAPPSSDSSQTRMSYSRPPGQPPVSTVETLNQPTASQPLHSNTVFTGFQSQPPSIPSESFNQSSSSLPQSLTQESVNIGYYSPESVPSGSSYPSNVSVMAPSFSDPEKTSSYQPVSSSADYFSQPPVITPSNTPAYYNSSGRNMPQVPQSMYPNISHQNFNVHGSNVMNSELYTRIYEPVKPYWLFKDIVETKEVWCGFSNEDSERLEMAFQEDPQAIVPVDGGRYDALLNERIKKPVYFEAKNLQIRRCTWFFRSDTSQRFTPFPEEASILLEQQYSVCVTSGQWPKRLNIPGVGSVVLESPQLLLYYKNEVELWPTLPDSKASPKTVRRGLPENYEIMCSENNRIDHLVFVVQGIGSFCDLRFRTVAECVDGFRDIANKLLASHFKHEVESGQVGRVEFLPVAWHAKLHTSDQGFDRCMQNITLPSIPKLRHFTNDTLLDILLYSSPFYCQTIIDTVASDLNRLYEIFLKRNPGFSGKVFVAGHSLGSLILFDILSHQKQNGANNPTNNELYLDKDSKSLVESDDGKVISEDSIRDSYESVAALLEACQLEEYTELFEREKIDLSSVAYLSNDDLKDLGVPTGPRKKLLNALHSNNKTKNLVQSDVDASDLPPSLPSNDHTISSASDSESLIFPFRTSPCMLSISYPRLQFEPACLFALGSPISMFLTVRGYDTISEDFRFPTCPNFFHIFHPYDPVAFRIEPLIDPNFSVKPVLIPHHKGRKRMHLEIRENLSKVGFEIKQKVLETIRYTWNSLSGFAKAHTFPSAAVEAEVDKLVNQQMSESEYEQQASSETSGEEIQIGSLNGGRRIDYVLQEKPIEALNDYIFALTSHSTYWDSEDTVLMILREIYATQGILVSSQSILENKQLSHSDDLSYEAYAHLSSVMSNPCLYESSKLEQVPTNVMPFYNQSVPPLTPASSQSMHSLNSHTAATSQITSNVPPPTNTMQQPMGLSMTAMQQSMGLPVNTMQQAAGPPTSVTQQPVRPPTSTTQEPVGPPASATQPVGPPPLTGFVKRSPFAR